MFRYLVLNILSNLRYETDLEIRFRVRVRSGVGFSAVSVFSLMCLPVIDLICMLSRLGDPITIFVRGFVHVCVHVLFFVHIYIFLYIFSYILFTVPSGL